MSRFFTEHAAGPQTKDQTMNILTYEVGKILQCEEDAVIEGEIGYKSHSLTETGDAISMLRYYCEQIGVPYSALQSSIKVEELTKWHSKGQIPARISIYTAKVVQAHHYTKVFGSTLWHEKMGPALGGLKLLIFYYCDLNHWDVNEVTKMGEEHYLERMAHIRKEGIQGGSNSSVSSGS